MPQDRWHLRLLGLLTAALLGAAGGLLFTDRPGLVAEHFALEPSWQGDPVFTGIGTPQIDRRRDLEPIFVSQEIFSIRWRGWLAVEETGVYRFSVQADERGSLHIDGELVVASGGSRAKQSKAERRLARGIHSIEIAYSQSGGRSRLRTAWASPGAAWRPLAAESLFAGRPVRLRWLMRRATAELSPVQRRLLGSILLLAGLLLGRSVLRSRSGGSRHLRGGITGERQRQPGERTLAVGILLALFLLTLVSTLPLTTATVDGDDVRYLDAAVFTKKMGWIFNRYVHVYLLKAFIWLRDGEAFLGSRTYWSFLFAVTVTSLAVAVRALGPRMQIPTLTVALFLLLSEGSVLGSVGAAFADYSAMMFVTAAVAVYLHALSAEGRSRHEWHALAVGALSIAAIKSKETGLILAWLPVLYLWSEGRLDWRRFARKLGFWLAGAAAALLVLAAVDFWLLGDALFGVRLSNLGAAQGLKTAAEAVSRESRFVWLELLWSGQPRYEPVSFALRNLSALVALAALAAAARGRRPELVLLHLMPMAYVAMLMAFHPPVFSSRYLFPILPVSCLLGGALFHYLDLDRLSWREWLSPTLLVPVFLALVWVLLVVAPLRTGELAAAEIAPGGFLSRLSAAPGELLAGGSGVVVLVVIVTGALTLSWYRKIWQVALLVCLVGLFGTGLLMTQRSLARQTAAQRGELVLYPWRSFEQELRAERNGTILVSRRLVERHRMVGRRPTRTGIARIFFHRPRLRVRQVDVPGAEAEVVIGSRQELSIWRARIPGIDTSAIFDPSGQLVLVRPRATGPG